MSQGGEFVAWVFHRVLPAYQPQVPTVSTWTNSGNSSPASVTRALIWEFLVSGTRRQRVLPCLTSSVLRKGQQYSRLLIYRKGQFRDSLIALQRKHHGTGENTLTCQLPSWSSSWSSELIRDMSGDYDIRTHSRNGRSHTSLTTTL